MQRFSFLVDKFLVALVVAIALALLLPIHGFVALIYDRAATMAIALLFFLHGARLSRQAVVSGATNWRLHLSVLGTTFLFFPIIGLFAYSFLNDLLTPLLAAGVLFLCLLPSTVQSSVVFTSIAGGNVSAAVCAATLSNILGVVVTPVLVGLLLTQVGDSDVSLSAIGNVLSQIVAPFVAGQFARKWVGSWVLRHPRIVKFVDQGAIVMVVYGAFSASVIGGLWSQMSMSLLGWLLVVDSLLLFVVMALTHICGHALFSREERLVLLFCGSKKSLASGIPIAKVLFSSSILGPIILPLMIFHQVQLVACSFIARRSALVAEKKALSG